MTFVLNGQMMSLSGFMRSSKTYHDGLSPAADVVSNNDLPPQREGLIFFTKTRIRIRIFKSRLESSSLESYKFVRLGLESESYSSL